jgi:hypothetical protein
MFYAKRTGVPPKSIDDRLIALKDVPFDTYAEAELRAMHGKIRDRNLRIFTDREAVYVFNRDVFLKGVDPGELFAQLDVGDARHAFYLGRELERAALAVRLGKKYVQESGLRWGYLDEGSGGS